MNLGRIGHYFTPNSAPNEDLAGSCRTAIVTDVSESHALVDIAVWEHRGAPSGFHQDVPVSEPQGGEASFHLNMDCPWKR